MIVIVECAGCEQLIEVDAQVYDAAMAENAKTRWCCDDCGEALEDMYAEMDAEEAEEDYLD